MNCIIRKSNKEDCYELAHLITIVWNETYKGIVSDEFLITISNDTLNLKKYLDKFIVNLAESKKISVTLEIDTEAFLIGADIDKKTQLNADTLNNLRTSLEKSEATEYKCSIK